MEKAKVSHLREKAKAKIKTQNWQNTATARFMRSPTKIVTWGHPKTHYLKVAGMIIIFLTAHPVLPQFLGPIWLLYFTPVIKKWHLPILQENPAY